MTTYTEFGEGAEKTTLEQPFFNEQTLKLHKLGAAFNWILHEWQTASQMARWRICMRKMS